MALDADALVAATWTLAAAMAQQYSSTAQDIARGNPTEIDALNGFVAGRGAELGVPTPINRTLQALVKLRECSDALESMVDDSLWPLPNREFVPAHWAYREAKAALNAAGRFVNTELAERRNLILANPIEGNKYPTVKTLICAYQMVKAGETATAELRLPPR